jgi:site-specific DNA-methyltransferase (adenine-specific)
MAKLSQQPAASSQQPAASSQQPAASSQQPAASSQQPAASNMPKFCDTCGAPMAAAVKAVAAEDGRFTLYHNDFREVAAMIPAGSVAAVITDPPYGSGGFTVKDRCKSSKTKYVTSAASYQKTLPDIDGDALHPKSWEALMQAACAVARRVLAEGGILAMFIDWRNKPALQGIIEASGLTLRGIVVWDKGLGSRPIKNGFRNQAEYLLWATQGPMPNRSDTVYLPGVLRHTSMTTGKVHITQKPLALMEDIIPICPPGGLVFDMFMGAGTTGVAALKHGRRFIGCESVGRYFDTAVERCAAQAELMP